MSYFCFCVGTLYKKFFPVSDILNVNKFLLMKGENNMKIKEIKVTNFRACPDGRYPLSDVTVLLGKNGKGKSSLQMALRYLLSGKLPADPIRHGQEYLEVSAILEGDNVELGRRHYLPDIYVIDGEAVSAKSFSKKVEEYESTLKGCITSVSSMNNDIFNVYEEARIWEFLKTGNVAGIRLNGIKELGVEFSDGSSLYMRKSRSSECFISGKKVSGKAFTKYLEERMQGNLNAVDIVTSSEIFSAMEMPDFAKYLMSILPVKMDFNKLSELAQLSQSEIEVLKGLFPEAPNPISLEVVSDVYNTIYHVRRDLNRTMNEWLKRSTFDGMLPLPSVDGIQLRLSEINKKIGANAALEKAWFVYNQRMQERQKSIQTLQNWINTYNEMGRVVPPQKGRLEELEIIEFNLRKHMENIISNISGTSQAAIPLEKMLINLNSKTCPLCEKLVCNTDKTVVEADLRRSIQTLRDNISRMEQEKIQIENQLTAVCEQKESERIQIERYTQKVELYKRIEELKASIPTEPEKPAQLVNLDREKALIEKYENYIRQSSILENCQNAYRQYCMIKKQYDLYCVLVKKTEPKKGLLTNTIISYLLQPFHDHVNGFLGSIYNDIKIEFQIGESGLEVKCNPHGRNTFMSIKDLSDGERMLAVFTLMDMVASVSNTRILVFDRLECMDGDTIQNLFSSILSKNVLDRYDHILIATVDHDDIMNVVNKYDNVQKIQFHS